MEKRSVLIQNYNLSQLQTAREASARQTQSKFKAAPARPPLGADAGPSTCV